MSSSSSASPLQTVLTIISGICFALVLAFLNLIYIGVFGIFFDGFLDSVLKRPPVSFAGGLGDKWNYIQKSMWFYYNPATSNKDTCAMFYTYNGALNRVWKIEADNRYCFYDNRSQYPARETFLDRIKLLMPADSIIKQAYHDGNNNEIYEFYSEKLRKLYENNTNNYGWNGLFHLIVNYDHKIPKNFTLMLGGYTDYLGLKSIDKSPFKKELFSLAYLEKLLHEERLSRNFNENKEESVNE